MDPALISAGISLAGSLFGGKKKKNPYEAQQKAAMARTKSDAEFYRTNYTARSNPRALDYTKRYDNSVRDAEALLKQQIAAPLTDQQGQLIQSQATANTNGAYDALKTQAAVNLARRGLSPAGSEGGRVDNIDIARAQEQSNAGQELALKKLGIRDGSMNSLLQLLTGARTGAVNEATNDLGSAVDQDTRYAGAVQGQYNAEQQRIDAENAAQDDGLAQLFAQLGVELPGLTKALKGSKKPKVSPAGNSTVPWLDSNAYRNLPG